RRVVRLSRRTPSRSSSVRTCLLTMAGDMSKGRAAAAKLADSTTLAKTAIPTKRSKRQPFEAEPGLIQVPSGLPLGRAFVCLPPRGLLELLVRNLCDHAAALIAALRGLHDVTAITAHYSPQQPRNCSVTSRRCRRARCSAT